MYNVVKNEIDCSQVTLGNFNTLKGNIKLGNNIIIGNNCTLIGNISIGDSTEIGNNVTIINNVSIGSGNKILSGTAIGYEAQHLTHYLKKEKTEDKQVVIGNNNIIRENVTIHLPFLGQTTQIGSNCFLMANAHISHDTILEDYVTVTNNVAIGGHSYIGRYATIGLNSCLHQFTRIGQYAMIGMGSVAIKDIPPFHLGIGMRNLKLSINIIGFERNYFGKITLNELKKARRNIIKKKTLVNSSSNQELADIFNTFAAKSKNGIYLD